jgi:hypothetical protein
MVLGGLVGCTTGHISWQELWWGLERSRRSRDIIASCVSSSCMSEPFDPGASRKTAINTVYLASRQQHGISTTTPRMITDPSVTLSPQRKTNRFYTDNSRRRSLTADNNGITLMISEDNTASLSSFHGSMSWMMHSSSRPSGLNLSCASLSDASNPSLNRCHHNFYTKNKRRHGIEMM